ncbi:MAG: SusC/RagA family TonB-linked outer membrane protein [Cytophagales bacterium]|nr:SusC/RagA family TonB-linked outer membrane protein [Cytophagales bacterium]
MLVLLMTCAAWAQNYELTGRVTDKDTGEGVPGVTVQVKGTTTGVGTDADGFYSIRVSENSVLIFSSLGYVLQEVKVRNRTTIDVALAADSKQLEEVIVTGVGIRDKHAFTGAIGVVKSESIEGMPVPAIDMALQGSVTGITVSTPSGTPGAIQDILIRGVSSVNASTRPLIVIDGIPVESGELQNTVAASELGVLSTMNMNDIESISVLKDAVATAPYGARGTNGVVVITTKSGKSGKPKFTFSVQRGISDRAIDGPASLSSAQWAELYKESWAAVGIDREANWDGVTDTDWGEEMKHDESIQQSYDLSMSSGNDKATVYASVSYDHMDGVEKGVEFERLSGKISASFTPNEKIVISNSLTGSFVEQLGILEGGGYFGNPVLARYFMLPIDKPYNEDGTYNTNLSNSAYNPMYIADNDISRSRITRVMNNTSFSYEIYKNLKFTSRLGLDYILNADKYYRNPDYGDGEDNGGTVTETFTQNINWVWQNSLDYRYELDDKNVFDFKAMQEVQKNNYHRLIGSGESFAATGLTGLNSTAKKLDADSWADDWSIASFTGLASYAFDNKLFIDGSLRREGSSKFADGNQWGTFWSVGAGYVLSNESFVESLDFVDFLKVRASYGVTGNAGIDENEYQTMLAYDAFYNDRPGIKPDQIGNPDLTWETAGALDLGLDFDLFGRLSGEFSYFRKQSKDLLFNVPLSRTMGHIEQRINNGEMVNRGVELALNVDIFKTQDFSWSVGFQYTHVGNEVTKLPKDDKGEDIEIKSAVDYEAVVGYPTKTYYMPVWAGVDPDNGKPRWYKDKIGGEMTSVYREANSIVQDKSPLPTDFGSITTNISFKGIYVRANLYYSFGNQVRDGWAYYMMSDGAFTVAFNQYASQFDRWQEPGDIAKNPQIIIGGNSSSNSNSTRFLYDGDYLRLKNLTVGYKFPDALLKKMNIGITGLDVYFLGANIWTKTFDDDLEYDPEVRIAGDDAGLLTFNAAPMKTYTFGLRLNF